MSKEWKAGEAIYHMKQAERNALDIAAMNKLNEMLDIAQLRTTNAEQAERIKQLEDALRFVLSDPCAVTLGSVTHGTINEALKDSE